jgi:Cu/Ag efflux pump CusA
MGGLVAEAMRKVDSAVKLPVGYTMVWAAVQDQQRALARLTIMVRW